MEILAMSASLLKLAAAGCAADIGILAYKNFKNVNSKTGSAYVGGKKEIKNYLGICGIKLSKNYQLSEKAMYGHIAIFGKTESYKSSGIYIPNLLANDLPRSSIIVSDMKGELYELTSEYQQNVCGREVKVFCPLHPEKSIGINPLALCRDITDVRKLGQILLANGNKAFTDTKSGGAEWLTMATPLLVASMLYVKNLNSEQCNISNALDIVITNDNKQLEMLFSNSTTECYDEWNVFKTCLSAEGAAASVKITLASALQSFLDYKIASITSRNDFKPTEMRKRPIILYVIYEEVKADYLAPLMATVFSQLIDFNLEYFDTNKTSLPIFTFLDEFCNLGFISGLNHIVTAARSRKFSLNLCIHDICQMYRLYGQDLTKTVCNNLTTKVVLPGISEVTTLQYISDICGECEISVQSQSKSGEKTTVSTSKQKKPLYAVNEIRCLKDKTCIITINNKQVVKDKLNIYFENDMYLQRIVRKIL